MRAVQQEERPKEKYSFALLSIGILIILPDWVLTSLTKVARMDRSSLRKPMCIRRIK